MLPDENATTDAGASTLSAGPPVPTETVWLRDVEQPALLVSMTEYVVVVLGLTVIDGVVAPFDQRMLEMFEPLTVSVTEPPA